MVTILQFIHFLEVQKCVSIFYCMPVESTYLGDPNASSEMSHFLASAITSLGISKASQLTIAHCDVAASTIVSKTLNVKLRSEFFLPVEVLLIYHHVSVR